MTDMLQDVARAICRNDPMSSCIMDDHPERDPCSMENCMRMAQAVAVVTALMNVTPEMKVAGQREWDRTGDATLSFRAMLAQILPPDERRKLVRTAS